MAFNAGTAWEVRTSAASADGGGGFVNTSNLAVPTAPTTGTATTGGTVAANTYYAVVCYLDANGNPGPKSTQTSQVTTGATSTLTVTSPAASAGAQSYAVWWTTTTGGPYWPSPGTAVAIGTNSTRTTTPATSGTQPPGTDYSQQDAAQIAYTDAVVAATTTTATSVLNPFTPAMVGNVFNVTSGGTVQRAQITAVSAAAIATFDKSLGTAAQICVGNLGGALQSLSAAALLTVAGNTVYVKSGTYSETLTISVAGGNGTPITWIGYDATRGDVPLGTGRPLIDAAGTRANCVDASAVASNAFAYFRFAGGTASNAIIGAQLVSFRYCKSSGSSSDGWRATTGQLMLFACEASGNTGIGVDITSTGALHMLGGYIHDNISNGVSGAITVATVTLAFNIIEANGAAAVTTRIMGTMVGNTIDGNTGGSTDGYLAASTFSIQGPFIGNAFTGNARYGINRGTTAAMIDGDYNGYNGNVTAAYNNVTAGTHDVTTSPGYVDAANGNFAIGTAWKALGWPGVFPGGLSTGYMDIGAVQRQEAGSSAGMLVHPGMEGGCKA